MNEVGLVLEGGGMRGLYTAGVLDVLMDEGIRAERVVGVSAGAIHGCTYVSGQRGRNLRYYLEYCQDPRFMSFRNFLKEGNIVGTQFSYVELPRVLYPFGYEAFKQSGIAFYAMCTDLETGKAEAIRLNDMWDEIDVLRASASLPYFSRPVAWKGKTYLDGGCADSIPLKAAQALGSRRNIVVLTQPADYVKKPQNPAMVRLFYHRYPEFCRALESRHEVYNAQKAYVMEQAEKGDTFVILPSRPLKVGRTKATPAQLREIYDLGVQNARDRLDDLKRFLNA